MKNYCSNCGSELKSNEKFCSNCGSPVNQAPTNNYVNNQSNNGQNNNNGMATAGFVVSLISTVLCCGAFNWLSLIFSIIGLTQAKSKNGNGKSLAIAGIIISSISLVIFIISIITGVLSEIIKEAENYHW